MDIQRQPRGQIRGLLRNPLLITVALVLVVATVTLRAYAPSTISVDRNELWIAAVERGSFTRAVKAPGTLVTNELRWIAARSGGRVEQILQLPGSPVTETTLLLELSNPDIVQQARIAHLAFVAARAEHKALLAQLAEDQLAQEVRLLEARTNLEQAKFRYAAELVLSDKNIISGVDLNESRLNVQQSEARLALEEKRTAALPDLHLARGEASAARLEQVEEGWQLAREAADSLKVYAGIDGVLQELPVEAGQRVSAGTLLARVADPSDLRAELRIAEYQARDIALNQTVAIDVRSGELVSGVVSRLDPAVENGTVTVDVRFTEALPGHARIDQSIDGEIQLEQLDDVLFVTRPSQLQSYSEARLFRVAPDRSTAERVAITTGAGSVRQIQIMDGLREGDEIILSDTSRWQDQLHLTLNE